MADVYGGGAGVGGGEGEGGGGGKRRKRNTLLNSQEIGSNFKN